MQYSTCDLWRVYCKVLYGVLVKNYQIKYPESFDQEFPLTFGFRVDPEVKKNGGPFPPVSFVSLLKSCGVAECAFRRAHRCLNWHFIACIRTWDPSEARGRDFENVVPQ